MRAGAAGRSCPGPRGPPPSAAGRGHPRGQGSGHRVPARLAAVQCGTVTKADAPEGAAGGPVCYGPNLTAAALLCHAFGQLGQERTAEVVNGLFGTGVSAGSINKIAARLAGSLHGFEDDVKTALLAEPVTLADETPVTTIEDAPRGRRPGRIGPGVPPARVHPPLEGPGVAGRRAHPRHGALDLFACSSGTPAPWSQTTTTATPSTSDPDGQAACNAHLIRSAAASSRPNPPPGLGNRDDRGAARRAQGRQ